MIRLNINFEKFIFRNDDDSQILNDAEWIISTKKSDFASLTEGEKTIITILKLDGEVGNGGFEQYFFNTEGIYIDETIKAFERIGETNNKSLFLEAVAIFESDKSESIKEMEWEKIDRQYYKLNKENLFRLMVLFIKGNIEQFS